MNIPITGSTTKLPFPELINCMTSKTTAETVDQVNIGSFDPDKVFTQNNAEILGALATAAYATPKDQEAHIEKQPGVESFHFLDSANNAKLGINSPDTGTNASVIETDKALIVAVRGTPPPGFNPGKQDEWSWKDLGEDIDAVPVKNYDGSALVHAGFKNQADGIWDQLKPYLTAAIAEHKAIHFTGHSLGAAVALELADRMHNELGVLPESVLRLAGPDIGWTDEKKHLDAIGLSARTINVVNTGDPIPLSLPLGAMAGTQVYLDRQGNAEVGDGMHLFDRAAMEADDVRDGNALIPLEHHIPQLYVAGLADPQNAAVYAQLEDQLNHSA